MTNKVQPVVIKVEESSAVSEQREKWTSKADFIASCIGYTVGLGNIWRFPYLCYKNGGGNFISVDIYQSSVFLLRDVVQIFKYTLYLEPFSTTVAYFMVIFPYIVLCILLVRGVTLSGALDGIIFYVTPDVEKLLDCVYFLYVWIDAATQIFFSLSVGLGGLLTYASYNDFNNNVFRDAVWVSCINCATSVGGGFVIFSAIGFMAHTLNREVAQVVSSGHGLGFVAYPEGIAQMPAAPVWAVMFFMLFTIGLGSQFVFTETTIAAVMDTIPKLRPYKGRCLFMLCLISYLIGLYCVTKGGIYVLNIFDSQSGGFSLICVVALEAVAVSWGYELINSLKISKT
ncbi:sodium- and chloride-dependent GABA transporter 1-like [Stylophora pistillata]|uniref:sodium- and chloride-dependent GABA transporter 1-like n=1 Tax=Stylophora pistillata TaxID=50429 RepID=UPI000C05287A|nr:sodium- and chloride-dependent GABA transporter 1-like [Stylophora pistillata]